MAEINNKNSNVSNPENEIPAWKKGVASVITIAMVIIATLSGCGGGGTPTPTPPTTNPVDSTAPLKGPFDTSKKYSYDQQTGKLINTETGVVEHNITDDHPVSIGSDGSIIHDETQIPASEVTRTDPAGHTGGDAHLYEIIKNQAGSVLQISHDGYVIFPSAFGAQVMVDPDGNITVNDNFFQRETIITANDQNVTIRDSGVIDYTKAIELSGWRKYPHNKSTEIWIPSEGHNGDGGFWAPPPIPVLETDGLANTDGSLNVIGGGTIGGTDVTTETLPDGFVRINNAPALQLGEGNLIYGRSLASNIVGLNTDLVMTGVGTLDPSLDVIQVRTLVMDFGLSTGSTFLNVTGAVVPYIGDPEGKAGDSVSNFTCLGNCVVGFRSYDPRNGVDEVLTELPTGEKGTVNRTDLTVISINLGASNFSASEYIGTEASEEPVMLGIGGDSEVQIRNITKNVFVSVFDDAVLNVETIASTVTIVLSETAKLNVTGINNGTVMTRDIAAAIVQEAVPSELTSKAETFIEGNPNETVIKDGKSYSSEEVEIIRNALSAFEAAKKTQVIQISNIAFNDGNAKPVVDERVVGNVVSIKDSNPKNIIADVIDKAKVVGIESVRTNI